MKNKKAISPIIATCLIIGFTMALAAVIIFIEPEEQPTEENVYDFETTCRNSFAGERNVTLRLHYDKNIISILDKSIFDEGSIWECKMPDDIYDRGFKRWVVILE